MPQPYRPLPDRSPLHIHDQYEPAPTFLDLSDRDQDDVRTKSRPRIRFFNALVYTFGVSAILGMLMAFGHHQRYKGDISAAYWTGGDFAPTWPGRDEWSPTNGCLSLWENDVGPPRTSHFTKYRAKTNITLNPHAPSHLLVAQRTNGDITFKLSTRDVDYILVDVIAHYYDVTQRSAARICKIMKQDTSEGVGISVGDNRHGTRPEVSFSIAVHLPRQTFKHFETDLPSFTHIFDDLRNDISFDDLKVKAKNADIRSHGVTADRADIRTTNAIITGQFKAYEELTLETDNGAIKVDVDMLDHSDTSLGGSALHMKTHNSRIASTVKLLHATDQSKNATGGIYKVDASTSNANINLEILDAPPLSQLTLHSETTNAANHATLPPSYEGSFAAETSAFVMPRLHQSGKKTVSSSRVGRGVWEGTAYWTYENRNKGSAVIKTTNSVIDLSI